MIHRQAGGVQQLAAAAAVAGFGVPAPADMTELTTCQSCCVSSHWHVHVHGCCHAMQWAEVSLH